MARCRLIGKTRKIISVLILSPEGKLEQHRMTKGKVLELDESQLTFHTQRMINKKALVLEVLKEETPVVVPVVIKEEPAEVIEDELNIVGVATSETDLQDESAPKKKRGRKKKAETDSESLDLEFDEDDDFSVL